MAQLKDLIVNGATRLIGDIFTNKIQITTLNAPTSAGGTAYGPGSNGNVLRSNESSVYWSSISKSDVGLGNVENTKLSTWTGSANITTVGTITSGTWKGTAIEAAYIGSHSTDKLTSGTLPVSRGGTGASSFTTNSIIMSGSTTTGALTTRAITNNTSNTAITTGTNIPTMNTIYYGLATINNASQSRAVSIYAPTTGGTADTQALVGNGATTAPKWVNISPSITITAGTASATPKINVTVLDKSGTAQNLTTATTGVYGCTKLSSSSSTSEEGLAATPKGVWAAINTLDVTAPTSSGSTLQFIDTVSQTDGKISATKKQVQDASDAQSGVVNTTTQTFAGNKTFKGHIYPQATNTYDLGSSSLYWKGAYINGNGTIHWNNLASPNIGGATNPIITEDTYRGLGRIMGARADSLRPSNNLFGVRKSSIVFEYTTDGGSTWTTKDIDTKALFNENTTTITPGFNAAGTGFDQYDATSTSSTTGGGSGATYAANYWTNKGIRITVDTYNERRTGTIDLLVFRFGTAGSNNKSHYIIERQNYGGTWTTIHQTTATAWNNNDRVQSIYVAPMFYLSGTSTSTNATYARKLRFTFIVDAQPTAYRYAPRVISIAAYGIIGGMSTASAATCSEFARFMTTYRTPYLIEDRNSGTLGFDSDLLPRSRTTEGAAIVTDNVHNIGGSSRRWANVYANTFRGSFVAPSGTMTGTLTIKGLKGTSSTDYGATLPSSGAEGQIFFQTSDPAYELPTGGTTGQMLVKSNNNDRAVSWSSTAPQATNIYSSASTSKAYVLGTTTASSAYHATVYNASVYTNGSVLYGAAWNDYAEYRKDNPRETQYPGQCVREVGDGTLALTTKRLERGCEIISDTFGFAIGQDEDHGYNTPIASSGRVLVYLYESIEEAKKHIGWPVCSGPNGTVSIMTEEEEEKYPSRIIGTISEIPDYDIWGADNIEVNGRIWIRIR